MKKITLKSVFIAAIIATTYSCSTDSANEESISNFIDLQKTQLFTTSNNSGQSVLLEVDGNDFVSAKSFSVAGADVAGVYYDQIEDCLVQASRTDKQVRLYDKISTTTNGSSISPVSIATDGFVNARDIAAATNNKIVVSSDAAQAGDSNKFYIYSVTPSGLVFQKQYLTPNQNWGIHVNGNDMYAVNDNSNQISIFSNIFNNNSNTMEAANFVKIQGATSLKGLTYDADSDTMILTDVRNQFNDSDGAIYIVENFRTKLNQVGQYGTITSSMFKKIEGNNTLLGTPLDVQYDSEKGIIYVAERSTQAGMVLAFDIRNLSSENVAPSASKTVKGVSSLYLKK